MQITYLIGAGASCNCLPIVNQIPKRYTRFIKRFKKLLIGKYGYLKKEFTSDYTEDSEHWENLLYRHLKYFEPGIHRHYSVDTYAKKMFLSKDNKLRYYKLCLSIFFTYEQIRLELDQRYDTFFASILKENLLDFPDNLNILSWNYDMQFEIAYTNLSEKKMIEDAKETLKINTKNEILSASVIDDKFHIIKLNGSTEVYNPVDMMEPFYLKSRLYDVKRDIAPEDVNQLGEVLRLYDSSDSNMTSLSFAWENDSKKVDSITQRAVASTKNTETLIIIGYSFPYFNRLVDRQVFDSMVKLKKIYIQDPNAELMVQKISELCARIPSRRMPEIVPYKDVSQFLVPNELD